MTATIDWTRPLRTVFGHEKATYEGHWPEDRGVGRKLLARVKVGSVGYWYTNDGHALGMDSSLNVENVPADVPKDTRGRMILDAAAGVERFSENELERMRKWYEANFVTDQPQDSAEPQSNDMPWKRMDEAPTDGTSFVAWCVTPIAGEFNRRVAAVIARWVVRGGDGGQWVWDGPNGALRCWVPLPTTLDSAKAPENEKSDVVESVADRLRAIQADLILLVAAHNAADETFAALGIQKLVTDVRDVLGKSDYAPYVWPPQITLTPLLGGRSSPMFKRLSASKEPT